MTQNGNAYDAIVVGGGHNGLVSAAYLARAGLAPTRSATSAIRVSLKPRSAISVAAAASIWSRRTSATASPCSRAAIGPLSRVRFL